MPSPKVYPYQRYKKLSHVGISWSLPNPVGSPKQIGGSFDIDPVSSSFEACLKPISEIIFNKAVITTRVPDRYVFCSFLNPNFVEPFQFEQPIFFRMLDGPLGEFEPTTALCPDSFPAPGNTPCGNLFDGGQMNELVYGTGNENQGYLLQIFWNNLVEVTNGQVVAFYEAKDIFYPNESFGIGTLTITWSE